MIIAHISDFHLRPDKRTMCLNKIDQIKKCILSKNAQIIVYTGDIVDYRFIESDENKKKESFEFALEAFRKLFSGYNMNSILFCPGNHDLIRQPIEYKDDCTEIDENGMAYLDAFSYYDSFLKELGLSDDESHLTRIKTIISGSETLNFLVANTNCFVRNVNSKSTTDCINCCKVNKLANSKVFSGDKKYNIFVSHLPLDYICECGKHHYKDNDANLCEILFERFHTFLAGDKHCKSCYSNTYIVGNPLYEADSFLSIHEIKENYHTCEYIKVDETGYSITADKTVCNDVFDLCKRHLSARVSQLLRINENSKFSIIDEFMQNDGLEMICDIENLYDGIVNFKEYNSSTDSFTNLKPFSFNQIANIIEDYEGENRNVINLKGEHESGKSTFLSMLFIYLLYKHTYQSYKYIPLYFNIEKYRTNGMDSKTIMSIFDGFVSSSQKIRDKSNKPICYIIDGLNQYQMFGDNPDLGDYFDGKLQNITDTCPESVIILSIDTFDHPLGFYKSIFDIPGSNWKFSKYLIYLNPIVAIPQNEEQLIKQLKYIFRIKSSADITDDDINRITSKVFNEAIIDIPLIFLYNNIEEFSKNTDNLLHSINTQRLATLLKNEPQRKEAGKIAVRLFHNNETFAKIFPNSANRRQNIKLFEYIKGHRFFYNYLIAQHYVTEINKLANCNKKAKGIQVDRFVNAVFPQPIFYSIRQEFNAREGKGDVQKCLELLTSKKIKNIDCIGVANLVYLLGRNIGLDDKKYLNISSYKFYKNKNSDSTSRFKSLILQRTITISNIMIEKDENIFKQKINNYLVDLIKDGELRDINRIFHLMYYQDTLNLMLIQSDYSDSGKSDRWDFYYTYHTLLNRIKNALNSSKERKLLELNIFTLCDLINTRLQHNVNDNSSTTFFYSINRIKTVEYILNGVIDIIDKYLNEYGDKVSNTIFLSFIQNCQENYRMFPIFLSQGNDQIFLHPSILINQLYKLKSEERKGWLIQEHHDTKTLSMEKYLEQKIFPSVESVVDHIYYTYLIGLLYLPETIVDSTEYNKQEVLNIILLHDLGESYTGDLSPCMTDYEKSKIDEDKFNRRLFSSWINIYNVDFSNQLRLWDLWSKKDSSNINYQIANELDKLQLLYQLLMIPDSNERFSDERLQDLQRVSSKIKSPIVIDIKRIIIDQNKLQTLEDFFAKNKGD